MILKIPYGKDTEVRIELADQLVAGVVEPRTVEIGDQAETIRKAITSPLGPQSIEDFLADARNVLVIVNDATRPTPTRQVLDVLSGMFNQIEVDFLVATGIHRAPTEEEYLQIFGQDHYQHYKDRIYAHDSRRSEDMVFLGRSKNGTEMRVNRRGVEAHKIIIISSVEPHYFAGYTGGRKSFLPGIAAYETIEQNHKLALKPEAKALALDGNPVHEDMIDALKTVKQEIFAINTVLDKKHRIYAAAAGDINESFLAATQLANQVFAAPISQKADIVVSVVKFPGDIDLYQAQKGIDNAKHALKEGGILILVAKCRCGVGEESFVNLLSSANSPKEVLEIIEKKYLLGYHKAAKMAEVGLWAETWAVSDLEPDLLEKIFIRPCSSLPAALDDALQSKGPTAQVLFLLDGGLTVPIVEKQS
jgi:lactate racemase